MAGLLSLMRGAIMGSPVLQHGQNVQFGEPKLFADDIRGERSGCEDEETVFAVIPFTASKDQVLKIHFDIDGDLFTPFDEPEYTVHRDEIGKLIIKQYGMFADYSAALRSRSKYSLDCHLTIDDAETGEPVFHKTFDFMGKHMLWFSDKFKQDVLRSDARCKNGTKRVEIKFGDFQYAVIKNPNKPLYIHVFLGFYGGTSADTIDARCITDKGARMSRIVGREILPSSKGMLHFCVEMHPSHSGTFFRLRIRSTKSGLIIHESVHEKDWFDSRKFASEDEVRIALGLSQEDMVGAELPILAPGRGIVLH